MQSLILHPTSIAQWHALLNEAQRASTIYLREDLEAYLVFLLMRFMSKPAVASSVLGLDFLKSYQQRDIHQQFYLLKDVGDRCLLFAGLFPGRATRQHVTLSYFVKLGQTAYSTVSNQLSEQENLFIQLCHGFPKLMDLLQAMREMSRTTSDLLQSIEQWHETEKSVARHQHQATQGFTIIPPHKSH